MSSCKFRIHPPRIAIDIAISLAIAIEARIMRINVTSLELP